MGREHRQPFPVLKGRGRDGQGEPALAVLREMVRRQFQHAPIDEERQIGLVQSAAGRQAGTPSAGAKEAGAGL